MYGTVVLRCGCLSIQNLYFEVVGSGVCWLCGIPSADCGTAVLVIRSAGLVLCTSRSATEVYLVPGNMSRQGAELGFSEPTATLQRPTFRRPIIMDTGGNLATSLGAIALAGWRRVVRGALGGGWRAALPAGPGARARPRGRGPARTGGRRRRAVAQLAVRSGHGPHRGRGVRSHLPCRYLG